MNWNTYHEQYQSGAGRNPLVSLRLREAWLSDARDGVLLEVGRLGREVGSGSLLLLLEAHTVPVVGQGSRLALPVLKEDHSWKKRKELTRKSQMVGRLGDKSGRGCFSSSWKPMQSQ